MRKTSKCESLFGKQKAEKFFVFILSFNGKTYSEDKQKTEKLPKLKRGKVADIGLENWNG
ncbi:hypothetical protein BXU11_16190 [Flavobacterium sp. LM5]|nr:hypothetical protein BXU11_16190 [Flavobacterium sp. LM5]